MPEAIRLHFGDGEKWNVDIHYVHEDTPLGTGGSLGLLPNNLPDLPIIMMNGDVLTKIDFEQLLEYHNQHHKYFINAGVYVVSRQLADTVSENQRVDMTDLIETAITNDHYIAMFPVHEYWLDIGKMVDFYQAQKDVMQGGRFDGGN